MKIQIKHPMNNGGVKPTSFVVGTVCHHKTPVQIYILSNDNKWYLQKPVKRILNFWVVLCNFGDSTSENGSKYTIAAVASKDRPESPVDKLDNIVTQIDVTLVKNI